MLLAQACPGWCGINDGKAEGVPFLCRHDQQLPVPPWVPPVAPESLQPLQPGPMGTIGLDGSHSPATLDAGWETLSGHSIRVRGWPLIQETGTLLHHPKTL